ncbi:cytochrome P450 4C1-like [Anoplophora glabripennis]|uniref:cytochrome P450 4C1-like n=1 Tax=Anoplophora glabripennis TaxID=217634 RepID=UPI000A13A4EA|nr:cytochrome P450 4C1-like [Anoplophora glabripennis]
MWEYLVLIVAMIPYLLYIFSWLKNYQYWKHIMAIPGPKSYPMVGTMMQLIFDEDYLFYSEEKRSKSFYPIYKHWSFTLSVVCLINAEDIELVLNNIKHIKKGQIYDFLHEWLGTGLLTSSGSKWQNRRKIRTPAFHFSILQEFVSIFNRETEKLVEVLERDCDKPYINVLKPITEFTLCSLGETSLGVDLSKGQTSYKEAVFNFGVIFMKRLIKPWYHNEFVYSLSPLAREQRKVVKVLHELSTRVISERKKLFSADGQISYSDRKRLAMLDLMLKAKCDGADIDEEGIREEVDTFMFEGHDTTSMAICFALMVLANEEKIQEEILKEVEEVLGHSGKLPTYNDLVELKFMERCIKECLRLYPSVPLIARVAGEDIKTHTGYIIPKGCGINIYIYDLHRSSEYWENPEKFDPDRFLPENVARRHPFAYLPFSAGFRNCIGQKFAILEIMAALCGILRKFKLKAVDTPKQIQYKHDIVLRPVGEVRVKFVLRK